MTAESEKVKENMLLCVDEMNEGKEFRKKRAAEKIGKNNKRRKKIRNTDNRKKRRGQEKVRERNKQ